MHLNKEFGDTCISWINLSNKDHSRLWQNIIEIWLTERTRFNILKWTTKLLNYRRTLSTLRQKVTNGTTCVHHSMDLKREYSRMSSFPITNRWIRESTCYLTVILESSQDCFNASVIDRVNNCWPKVASRFLTGSHVNYTPRNVFQNHHNQTEPCSSVLN